MQLKHKLSLLSLAIIVAAAAYIHRIWPTAPEPFLQFPTEYGEASFVTAGSAVQINLARFELKLEQTRSVRLLRENDTGGFFLLQLERTTPNCSNSLIYLLVADQTVELSAEFGACLQNIEAFEDWTGIYVKGQTPAGETATYRLHHTGAVPLLDGTR